jgi:glycosidase
MAFLKQQFGFLGVLTGGYVIYQLVDAFAQFESKMNNVRAVSQATATEFAFLNEKAQELGSTTRYTAGQVAEGMSFMAMAGLRVGDIYNGINSVLTLASAGHVSRFARDQREVAGFNLDDILGSPADLELGLRRARAAVLLMLALPGSVYLYQGEELGLPEVEDLPEDRLTDPTWRRSGNTVRGRDGCRVPLPWSGSAPPFGFSTDDAATPWLPQPAGWRERTVAVLDRDPDSILTLYRTALRLRRDLPALGDGQLTWLDVRDEVVAFTRAPGFVCVVNFGSSAVELPVDGRVLLGSDPRIGEGLVAPDVAVWLETGR